MEALLVNTYTAYKTRESKVFSWLKEASQLDAPFRVNQIPILAKSIVNKGLAIPDTIVQLLGEVVSKRKEPGEWYKQRRVEDTASGHAHIIKVLEETLATFRSAKVSNAAASPAPKPFSDKESEVTNLFDLLKIDEARNKSQGSSGEDTDDENVTAEAQKSVRPNQKAKGKKIKSGKRKGKPRKAFKVSKAKTKRDKFAGFSDNSPAIYDEEDGFDEFYFIVYCFFQDFNIIREYIQERWCDYQDGLLSLSAVALTTNNAMELLQRAEKELLMIIPPEYGSYEALSSMLFYEVGLAHVDYSKENDLKGDKEALQESFYEEADFLCLPRYWDLCQWIDNTPPNKIAADPRRLDEKLEYEASSHEEKMHRDKSIMHEIISECTLLKAMHNDPTFIPPGEDEFTLGIIQMLRTRDTPIWLVFASQIYCDIRYILEKEVTRCHDELLATGHRVRSILQRYRAFFVKHDMHDFLQDFVETRIDEVECWVTEDFCGSVREKLWMSHGIPKARIEPYYYLRRQPLLCGMMVFRFSLTMNDLGVKISNGYGGTIGAAHLYNAIRHELPDFPYWMDMEALMLMHGSQRIFRRDQPPSNCGQYTRSYDRTTGISDMIEQRMAKNMSGRIIQPKKVEDRGLISASIVCSMYLGRFDFVYEGRAPKKTLPDIERLLNEMANDEMEDMAEGLRLLGSNKSLLLGASTTAAIEAGSSANDATVHQALKQKAFKDETLVHQYQNTGRLTMIQLLNTLCTRVARESYTLNFNYFSFQERCLLLLKAVSEEFASEIKTFPDFEEGLFWDRGELPCVPYFLFRLMEDNSKKSNIVERLGKVMKNVVEEEGDWEVAAVKKLFDRETVAGTTSANKQLLWTADGNGVGVAE
ncbi:hypothetical protein BP5796_08377 [Coleophoma crateriformis]|uniref:DUF6604 domain-containing protein n=1 Tax=Coleophoma crateriformis TaxID=565419 RepID=A0A3D8R7Q6_9HELO|nr:hypothetical protein BP5796_08377 [Coleophoma crateriformis]